MQAPRVFRQFSHSDDVLDSQGNLTQLDYFWRSATDDEELSGILQWIFLRTDLLPLPDSFHF